MSDSLTSTVTRAALTFAILGAGWAAYDRFVVAPPAAQAAPERPAPRDPYVASDTQLSADERLRMIVVPHPLGKAFDMRCVLYTSPAGAQMVCPNARQEQLYDIETDGVPYGAR